MNAFSKMDIFEIELLDDEDDEDDTFEIKDSPITESISILGYNFRL